MTAVRACSILLLSALWLGASGCGGDETTRSLVIELAQRPEGAACTSEIVVAPALPATGCLAISVWEGRDAERHRVGLFRTDGDHAGDGASELRLDIPESRHVTFDGRFGAGPHEIEVTLYDRDTGAPVATGANRRAVLGDAAVRVRLYAYGEWSCAGQRRDAAPNAQTLPRAMHAATTMHNGDVLVYGGVTGLGIPTTPAGGPVAQTAVEVYVASEERFVTASGSFNRVLFGSTLLPQCPPTISRSAECIRVVGGLEAPEGQALRFSASQVVTESALGSPILPGQGAELPTSGNSVLLVYDPRTRAVTEVADNLDGASRTAFVTMSDFGDEETLAAAAVGSVGDTGGVTFAPSFQSSAALLRADGTLAQPGVALGQNRLAAGVARLAVTRDEFLVWGGNITMSGGASPSTDAGRIVNISGGSTQVAAGGAGVVPDPVAFHTLTSIGAEGVLVAGGLKVGLPAGAGDAPILRLGPAAGRTLVYLRADAAGTGLVAFYPSDAGLESTILHTATRLPGGDVLLVGGSARRTPSGGSLDLEFFELQQVARVTAAAGAGTISWRMLPSLREGRFGHATAALSDSRVLVTGGFRRNGANLDTLASAEVLSLVPVPAALPACEDVAALDAGPPAVDAGPPRVDAGPPRVDAGTGSMDATVASPDAG